MIKNTHTNHSRSSHFLFIILFVIEQPSFRNNFFVKSKGEKMAMILPWKLLHFGIFDFAIKAKAHVFNYSGLGKNHVKSTT